MSERYYQMVDVPKAALMSYAGRPWGDVVAAAEAGADGLKLVSSLIQRPDPVEPDNGRWGAPPLAKDVARLREIDGRAFLFFQNWPAPYWETKMNPAAVRS